MTFEFHRKMKDSPANEDALKKMLKESGLESPSADFTASVMKMVAPQSKPSVFMQPVFSKKQVAVFFLLFGAFLIYAMLSGGSIRLNDRFHLDNIASDLPSITGFISSPVLIAVLISGWMLYIFDRFLKRRALQH
jgi:hypothetical protein